MSRNLKITLKQIVVNRQQEVGDDELYLILSQIFREGTQTQEVVLATHPATSTWDVDDDDTTSDPAEIDELLLNQRFSDEIEIVAQLMEEDNSRQEISQMVKKYEDIAKDIEKWRTDVRSGAGMFAGFVGLGLVFERPITGTFLATAELLERLARRLDPDDIIARKPIYSANRDAPPHGPIDRRFVFFGDGGRYALTFTFELTK